MAYMVTSNHHEIIQNKISNFYISLQRNQEKIIYDNYFELIGYVNFCYFDNNDETYLYYIKLLFKMALFVRDYQYGMGERDISYVLLCAWYKHNVNHFMSLYYYYLHTYGCWSDFKYFSKFIWDHSEEFDLCKKDIDFMIQHGISCVLFQFDKDLYNWNHVMHNYMNAKFDNNDFNIIRPIAKNYISNVAKWIPRENKKYGWLFESIVFFYNKIHYPEYFDSCKYSIEKWDKLMSKWKMDFRKLVSSLNKELQTPQIKQCNENWNNIDPQNISLLSLLKQKHGYYNNFYCKEEDFIQQHTSSSILKKTNLSIGYYVKEVLKLLKQKYDNKTETLLCLLETAWKKNVLDYYLHNCDPLKLPYIYAFMDISCEHDDDTKYNIIGNAIMLCMCSRNKEIFAIENDVYVLNFQNVGFIDIIRYLLVNNYLQSVKNVDVSCVLNFIKKSAALIDCPCNFVFLSTMKTCKMLCDPNLLCHKYIFTILWSMFGENESLVENYLCLNGSCVSVFHPLWKHFLKNVESGKNLQLNTYVYLNEVLNLRHYEWS